MQGVFDLKHGCWGLPVGAL